MTLKELKEFLDVKVIQYNKPDFIESDPLQIPHCYSLKEDIEISGFLTATIAWGNRKSIINNANRMMQMLEHSPHDFVINHQETDLENLETFVHRTFNGFDFITFIKALQHIYKHHHGLEAVFSAANESESLQQAIHHFKTVFFEIEHLTRTEKHVSDPLKNSAAKRLNMFLRWMVRSNAKGVDFGLWSSIPPSALMVPLDVHTGNTARTLNLLIRKQNDWKTNEEIFR